MDKELSPNSTALREQLSELKEKQNVSRMDTVMFLLIPLTTLGIGLSANWTLDPKYLSLGFPVSYVLGIVIALTVFVFLPTDAAYIFAYMRDSIASRIRALKIFLATCALWTFVVSLSVVAYVPSFVHRYDSGVFYQLAGIGGILVVLSVACFPYAWLYLRGLLWFEENAPLRFRRETITPWWGDRTDANKLTALIMKATALNGLYAMAAATYFCLIIQFTYGEAPIILGWLLLALCFILNAYSITKDALFLKRKLKEG